MNTVVGKQPTTAKLTMNTFIFKLTVLSFVLAVSSAQGADFRHLPAGSRYLLAARDNGDRNRGASPERRDRREQDGKPERARSSSGYGRGYEARDQERKATGKEQ